MTAAISVFDIFKIGIGPSSSHTMGPMKAARQFALDLEQAGQLEATGQVVVQLYGSLALTGRGHCTDRAVLLGLEGETADAVDVDSIDATLERIRGAGRLRLLGRHEIAFDEPLNLLFHRDQVLPRHSNGLRFTALGAQERAAGPHVPVAGKVLLREDFYSIGGGFIVRGDEPEQAAGGAGIVLPHAFDSGEELLRRAADANLSIPALMLENEKAWRTEPDIRSGLLRIWEVMKECVKRGLATDGVLPGGLKVTRRASKMYRNLIAPDGPGQADVLDWVNAFALAVN